MADGTYQTSTFTTYI